MFLRFVAFVLILTLTACDSEKSSIKDNNPCDDPNINCISELPDFSQIANTKEKKQAFFQFLYPMVLNSNLTVLEQREKAEALLSKPVGELTEDEVLWLVDLAQAHALEIETVGEVFDHQEILIRRLDIVPPSLALAQAANESAWGSSRFAKQANNLFGQWCYDPGCGLVPKNRNAGAKHEVRVFETVNHAVASYIRNINKHYAYSDLRKIRESKREAGGPFYGPQLVPGLEKYSERGGEYLHEINSMIKTNKLASYDQEFWRHIEQDNQTAQNP